MGSRVEKEKERAAIAAVGYLKNNQIVGLGTGSSAFYAIREIGNRIKDGRLVIKGGVPTSAATEQLARSLDIPLFAIQEVDQIDITIDGADEFTSDLALIKGGGGALFREKLVAALSGEVIVIADASKQVEKLGRFHLPIEVAPFADRYVLSQIRELGGLGKIRSGDSGHYLTDQQNHIIDVDFGLIDNPEKLSQNLNSITGVVCHGLFLGIATKIVVGQAEGIRILEA
jgi:ribose 5-phosphate isomerase A